MDEKEMSMREALNLALDQAMAAEDRVFLLGEDIADPGASGPTAGLSTKYGHDRVLDTPISEAAIVGAAIGAAIDGLLPVAEIMIMDFIGIAADQLINNAAKLRFMTAGRTTAPITVRTQVYGGLATGATHSQTFRAGSCTFRDEGDRAVHPARRQGLPRQRSSTRIRACSSRRSACKAKGPSQRSRLFDSAGQADIKRPGTDVTLISYGRSVHESLAAATALQEQGVSAEVVDLRTLVPLDIETIVESVRRTQRAVVVHDAVQFAGPGAEIVATLQSECFSELAAPIERVGAWFVPTPAAAALEAQIYPSSARVVAAAQRTLEKAGARG
jgi:pyruvate dehydrogenase E1 component beta subunit